MKARICDLCNKPISYQYCEMHKRNPIKISCKYTNDISNYPVDICDKCWKQLKEYIQNNQKSISE